MDKKVVLVTGGSSGIGKSCCEYLSQLGYIVYGTSRKKNADNTLKYKLLTLDVTKKETIKETVDYIYSKHNTIDILINNAGFGIAGAFEDTSYDEVFQQFDVNLFGVMNVTNSILPIFRKQGYGQIVNIGSVAGYVAIPFQGSYSACKAAVLSYTKALRNEVRPFNIKVSIVEPGDIKTGFSKNRLSSKKSTKQSAYYKRMTKSIKTMHDDEVNGGQPIIIAKAIGRILKRKRPPIAITVGFKYKTFKFLFAVLPKRISEYLVYQIYAK